MPKRLSKVSLNCLRSTAVGGPPATIFPSFFAASMILFHSFGVSADITGIAIASLVTTKQSNNMFECDRGVLITQSPPVQHTEFSANSQKLCGGFLISEIYGIAPMKN